MIILSAQNIAKAFGVNTVLRDVSLTVQQGDRIGLVGVNGCGKSTLMLHSCRAGRARQWRNFSCSRHARGISRSAKHGNQRRNRLERAAKSLRAGFRNGKKAA